MQHADGLRPIDEDKVREDILAQGYSIIHDAVPADTIAAIRRHWLDVYETDSEKRPVIWGPYYGEVNRVVWDVAPTHAFHRSYDFLWNAPQHQATRDIALALSRCRNRIAQLDEREGEYLSPDRYGIYITTSYYPPDTGWMAEHEDDSTDGRRHWHFILPLTFRGEDFDDGGLFLTDHSGQQIDVDAQMRPGSVVFFDGTRPHGVSKIQPLPGSSVGRMQLFAIPVTLEMPHQHDRLLENVSLARFVKSRMRRLRDRFRIQRAL